MDFSVLEEKIKWILTVGILKDHVEYNITNATVMD
jgi:hypothetical protein